MMNKNITVGFKIKNYENKDDNMFTFEGLASTWEKDLDNDVMVKGSFTKSLEKEMPVILYQHDRYEPIGMTISANETNEGLYIKANLPKNDSLVSGRVIPQMQVGSIKSMSIGFSVKRDNIDIKNGIQYIKECDLKEISLVTFPANTGANVTSFKSDINDLLEIKTKRELETHLRELGMSRKGAVYLSSKVDFTDGKETETKAINKIDMLIKELNNEFRNRKKT